MTDDPLFGQPSSPSAGVDSARTTPRRAITAEIEVMLRFALSRGLPLPPELHDGLACLDAKAYDGREDLEPRTPLATLTGLHALLVQAVAPALPVTLRLMEREAVHCDWRSVLGPIANIRRLVLASFLFLLLFVVISTSPVLDTHAMDGDIYSLDGLRQIVVMTFLLSAAGIGGSFQALFTAQRYVANVTYDPRYDGSYWTLIALGLVAGLLLSVLVPVSMEGAASPTLAKPVLALLGGFSCGLVYRVLQRLVDATESVFQSRGAGAIKD